MRKYLITILAIISLSALISGCSSTPDVQQTSAVNGTGFIQIIADPDDATVILDDVFLGKASDYSGKERAIKLDSTKHKLELKKDGHYSYFREIVISSGDTTVINVTLNKK